MKPTNNTILITGGGSGIGLGLAREFRKLGNQVIVSNRSQKRLAAAKAEGFATYEIDMSDAASIQAMARQVLADYPALNGVIQNAGIMQPEDLKAGGAGSAQDETVAINLLGPMRLNNVLIPHLLKQQSAFIMTVTSGLAFLPSAMFPTYCATKAAIHSYSQSLRYQLQGTSVEVLELAPPYVQTSLTGEHQMSDPNAMPLESFISEVMAILNEQPGPEEILVERVRSLRFAESKGIDNYNQQFKSLNDYMAASRAN
jgi:uncharacterized oxidoreductase